MALCNEVLVEKREYTLSSSVVDCVAITERLFWELRRQFAGSFPCGGVALVGMYRSMLIMY